MNKPESIVRTKDVIGVEVNNLEGEKLGEIEEIVLDKVSGQARYVVLSFGGILSMGDKYFAFPWRSISYNPDQGVFVLSVDKDKLKQAEGFDKNNWPDIAHWPETIDKFYL